MTISDLRRVVSSATSILIRFSDSKADALNDDYYMSSYVQYPQEEKYDDLVVNFIYPLRKDVLEAYVVIKKEDNKFYNEEEADNDDVIENILRGKDLEESKVKRTDVLINKIIAGTDVRKVISEAVSVSVVDKETGQGHAFDIDPWGNGKDHADITKKSVKSVVNKAMDVLDKTESYSASVEKVTPKKIVLKFMTSDDTGFWEEELSKKFKDLTKDIQVKLGDLGVEIGKPYEYTFSQDKETDSPCVYVSYDIR